MTTESAIQQDVQATTDKRPAKTDRMSALEEITARRNAEFEQETGVKIEATPVTPLDPDGDPDAAAAEAERARLEAIGNGTAVDDDAQRALQQQQETDAAARAEEAARRQDTAGIDPKTKRRLKVNGIEVEMTIEEMERQVQKGLSADQRLEEASRQRRELDERERVLAQQQATIQQASQQQAEVQVDPALATKFTTALQTGDVAQATQAFNEAVSSAVKSAVAETKGRDTATPPVDANAIAAQVRQQIAIDSVLAQSRADYPQLYADPDVEAVAASKISRLQAEGKPFAEALETVQGDLASKFGWKKAAQSGRQGAAPDTNRREEKLARKAQMDPEPSGLSVKSGTTQELTPTVHDTIREMAKARGQAV